MDDYASQRSRMVTEQIEARGVRDPRVLEALRTTPRHEFVLAEYRQDAYRDYPLPIGLGQTISQPYIVGLMTELLQLKGDETVLEVGTGSGYQAAVLSRLARQVHTIERFQDLAERAARIMTGLHLENVQSHVGDGSLGLAEFAPYQGILVTAAAPKTPQPLLAQLAERGRLVLPTGRRGSQMLELWQRCGDEYDCQVILPVAFVPLVGELGWKE